MKTQKHKKYKKTKRVKYSIFNPKPSKKSKKTKKHKLYPIMETRFNIREIAKQMILLEQHLANPKLRCPDCILKHSYTIEGLIDESVCLDRKMKYCSITTELSERYHEISKVIEDAVMKKNLFNNICNPIAQKLRFLRKPLVKLSAGMLKDY